MSPISKASRFLKPSSRSSWLESVINFILPLSFLLLPTFFFNLSWQGSSLDRLFFLVILTIIGLAAWLGKILSTGIVTWHWRKLDWLSLGALMAASVATFWSPAWRSSLFGGYGQPMRSLVFFWVLFFLYLLVVNNWSAKCRQWSWLAILISFSFITLYSTCQLFGLYVIPFDFTRVISFNPIGSLSNLAVFLGAALPFFLLAIGRSEYFCGRSCSHQGRLAWDIWLGLSALAAVVALVGLGSFTIWPVVIVGLLVVLVFGLGRLIKLTTVQLASTVSLLALSFILLVIGNFGGLKINLPSEVSLSKSFSWQIAKNSLAHRPILGSGLASFSSAFSSFKGADFNAASLWNLDFDLPSGWLTESLVVVGGLGSLLLLAVLVWGLILANRRLLTSSAELEAADLNLSIGLLASALVLLVGGFLLPVGNNLLLIFGLIWILLLVMTFDWPRRQPNWSWRSADRRASALWSAAVIVVAIGLLASLAYSGKLYLADVSAGRSIRLKNVDQQLNQMATAYRLAPWREMYGFGLAQLSWTKANEIASQSGQATGTAAVEAQTAARGYVQQAKQLLDQNAKSISRQPTILKTLASLYEMIGDADGAMLANDQLTKVDVNNPWPHAKMAQIKVVQAYQSSSKEDKEKLVNEALAGYQKALELKPNWAEAYYYRASLYQAIQKPVEATQDLAQAVNYSNGAANYSLSLAQLLNERAKTETDKASELRNQAQQILQSILAVDGNNVNALYVLAAVYRDGGQTEQAKQAVQSMLSKVQDSDKTVVEQQFADLLK